MRIAVAGGNGFIGRALTERLLDAGDDVVWLSHRPGRAEALGFEPGTVREVVFDYHDTEGAWVGEVASADTVVNLSGYPIASRWNTHTLHLIRESRIGTGRALIRAAADAIAEGRGPGTYVAASGAGYYGDRGDQLLHESDAPGDDWLARLAVDWETESMRAEEHGIRTVIMRMGIALGSEGFLPKFSLPMRLFVGGPVGSGRQWFPWICASDAARGYHHAILEPRLSGPVNLMAPEQVRMRDFSRALGHVMHRPSWLPVPTHGLRLVLGKVAPYTVFSQRMSVERLRASGFEWEYGELKDALANLLK